MTQRSGTARMFKARYTRWPDRLLALVWPPKRKRLRMLDALVGASEDSIRHEMAKIARDLTLYGNAYVKVERHD